MEKKDRRVKRTHRLLKAALLELVSEQPYESVTIRDITDQADIGYATFFRHFDGKDDLMLEIFTEIVEELESLAKDHGEKYFENEGYLLFEHVSKNRLLYESILGSYAFTKKFREQLKLMIQVHLDGRRHQFANPTIPFEVAAIHMASSVLGLIDWWITNDAPYSIESMAMIYERLVIQATWYAISTEDMDHSAR